MVCIACGMNVSISNIDIHFTAHKAHRDHTLPQAMLEIAESMSADHQQLLEAGDY